jgi:hypothetical protein
MITKIIEHIFCDVTMSHGSCMMFHDIPFLVNALTISQLRNYWCQEYFLSKPLIESHFQLFTKSVGKLTLLGNHMEFL